MIGIVIAFLELTLDWRDIEKKSTINKKTNRIISYQKICYEENVTETENEDGSVWKWITKDLYEVTFLNVKCRERVFYSQAKTNVKVLKCETAWSILKMTRSVQCSSE